MTEAVGKTGYEYFSSQVSSCEFADETHTRAIVTIPLMHVGVNDKFLEWTEEMLKEIAPMFRGIPFRYDLQGQQGSSHTPKVLYSPHFDVGWTYSDEKGAWYEDGVLWVKGEVTHPEVISKLERVTTDGKREINFGSMGVEVEKSICNITGKEDHDGEYIRGQPYNGKVCTSVPTKLKKALHVALTNIPADGEAEIKECVFQESSQLDKGIKTESEHKPMLDWLKTFLKNFSKLPSDEDIYKHIAENHIQEDPKYYTKLNKMESASMENQFFQPVSAQQGIYPSNQGMATSMGATRNMMGQSPSPEEILKSLAERIKLLEVKQGQMNQINQASGQMPNPEVVNNPNMASQTQDNSGGTQLGNTQNFEEDKNMEGQTTNAKTPVNPSIKEAEKKPETADVAMGAPAPAASPMGGMDEIKQLLMKILAKLEGNVATADVSDLINVKAPSGEEVGSGMAKEKITPAAEADKGNAKNKENMLKPEMVATADSDVNKMKLELADLQGKFDKLANSKVEMADNVPEFGGTSTASGSVEVADMSPSDRRKAFGEFGAFDAIFNGASSAKRYVR